MYLKWFLVGDVLSDSQPHLIANSTLQPFRYPINSQYICMINRVLALSLKFICCTLPFKSSAILQTVSTQSSSLLCLYGTSVFHDHLFTCLKGKDETLIGSLRCSFVCFYVKLLLTKKSGHLSTILLIFYGISITFCWIQIWIYIWFRRHPLVNFVLWYS